MDEKDKKTGRLSLPKTTTSDLLGRQSVRATFKLTRRAIDAMSAVSIHLGVKQKSLFDHLIGDADVLNFIASEAEPFIPRKKESIQKTYVISRSTLSLLDRISKTCDAPRDILVEYSIQRLLPIITREQEKHEKRKVLLKELKINLKQNENLLEKTRRLIGEEDPVYNEMQTALSVLRKTCINIESFIQRGELIEKF
ncbi:MAG: hypothetical protein JRF40_02595 [Deltaproteobacteria bacterium]|nr:hypothetical protein [Deltaproteobacteria bacterium]MBW2218372.1 hypothetical protein [Deltaproteobacteria bacterium]